MFVLMARLPSVQYVSALLCVMYVYNWLYIELCSKCVCICVLLEPLYMYVLSSFCGSVPLSPSLPLSLSLSLSLSLRLSLPFPPPPPLSFSVSVSCILGELFTRKPLFKATQELQQLEVIR